jgi:hypothetical protein
MPPHEVLVEEHEAELPTSEVERSWHGAPGVIVPEPTHGILLFWRHVRRYMAWPIISFSALIIKTPILLAPF